MKKIFKRFQHEDGYAGIIETLVGSVIMLIALTGTALVINQGLQTNLVANNYSRAITFMDTAMLQAKTTPYANLAIKTSGGENQNFINPAAKDVTGCKPLTDPFEGEPVIEASNGLEYCEIKQTLTSGTKFNVQTIVTEVNLDGNQQDKQALNTNNVSDFEAKRITVVVTWYDGKEEANGIPVMNQVQSEMTITPKIGDCIPVSLGGSC